MGWGEVCGLHGVMLAPDNLPGGSSGPRELGPSGVSGHMKLHPARDPPASWAQALPAGPGCMEGCGLGPLTTVSEPGRAGAVEGWRGTWQALHRCPKKGADSAM